MKRLTLILFLLAPLLVWGQTTYSGKVFRVIDGDTFVFQTDDGSLRVRMEGIDAPESDQDWGAESRFFLNRYLNLPAQLIASGTDRYGRTIGVLMVEGENINLKSIRTGHSWHYKYYSDDKAMAEAETLAKQEGIGLWQDKNPMPPWEFRRRNQ